MPLHHIPIFPLLLFVLACTSPAKEAATHERVADPVTARIDSFMLDATEAGFNGSVLVLRDSAVLLDKGYGLRDREQSLPNTPATVHAIGSITKQFTAACILKLQERGRLKVTDPMSVYLGGVPPDKSDITLHELLTHSAGFPDAIGDDNDAIDGAAFTKLAMTAPLEFKPGTAYNYSNVGYSLLGIIVEKVSGMAYERFLHDSLLVPAGLLRTGYRIPDWSKEQLAIGYRKDGTRWGTMLDQPTVNGGPGWHLRANGGILSTTHDMAAWVDALRTNKVLAKNSTDAMFTPHIEEGEGARSFYGYGWAIFKTRRGTRLITHNGGNGIQFADVLWFADEGVTVVLMSNASKRGMQDIAWEIGRMVFDPAYVPSVGQAAQVLAGVPDGPMGERMKALSTIIASTGDDAALSGWLRANLGPGFLADVPLERHLSVFKQLRKDIGANTIERVEQLSPEEFALRLKSAKDGALFRVMMQLRPSDALISGLGVAKGE
jgi:CubicO group peptidase (beta-lactamase class C family)